MKEYTYAKNPTAPRQTFICPNCGTEVIRRLSDVKNINLVFCDNNCRARYSEKLLIAQKNLNIDNKTMKKELIDMGKIIKWSVLDMANKFGRFEDLDELEQIARITIWKNYKEAHNGQGKPESYYISCIKKSIMNGLFRKEPFEITEIGFYKTRDGRKAFVYKIDEKIDDKYPVCYILEKGDNFHSTTKQGKYNINQETSLDIVAKWEN